MAADPIRALREADCLFDAAAVAQAYDRLAEAITREYAGRDPLLLCMMIGGLHATAEISRRLSFPLEIDYLHATRYRGDTRGGGLLWKREPDAARIAGRDLVVIDDILDEGHTLVSVREALAALAPASLKVVVLCEKLHQRRAAAAHAEFIGLQLPDRYVFGCGMDYHEHWRQLDAIYAVKDL